MPMTTIPQCGACQKKIVVSIRGRAWRCGAFRDVELLTLYADGRFSLHNNPGLFGECSGSGSVPLRLLTQVVRATRKGKLGDHWQLRDGRKTYRWCVDSGRQFNGLPRGIKRLLHYANGSIEMQAVAAQ